jgi:arginine exporter protein ArgO
MEPIQKRNRLIGVYLSVLFILLLCVSATPLLIRHGLSLNRRLIVEEETLETLLIITLFGISFVILRSFMHTLEAYQRVVNQVGKEKSKLVSRLAEAFNYIGTVNVEIHEIESVLCGVGC